MWEINKRTKKRMGGAEREKSQAKEGNFGCLTPREGRTWKFNYTWKEESRRSKAKREIKGGSKFWKKGESGAKGGRGSSTKYWALWGVGRYGQ